MKLDIKSFLKSPDVEMDFKGELKNQNSDYDISNLNLIFPILYNGKILDLNTEVLLKMVIKYKYNTNCDRCLKPLVKEETSQLEAYLLKDGFHNSLEDDANVEYFDLNDGEIFLDDVIISQIITSKPIKNLCSETCKGICPQCGKNLNEESCNCETDKDVDPRFVELQNLFKN